MDYTSHATPSNLGTVSKITNGAVPGHDTRESHVLAFQISGFLGSLGSLLHSLCLRQAALNQWDSRLAKRSFVEKVPGPMDT